MTAFERAIAALRQDVADSVSVQGDAVALEFVASSGRMIPVVIETTATEDVLLLSDAGETWMELVSANLTRFNPTEKDLRRLRELAALYDVGWDRGSGAFRTHARLANIGVAARRIVSASIALDGWRVWADVAPAKTVTTKDMVRAITDLAPGYGWRTEPKQVFPGATSGHGYAAETVLHRGLRKCAVATVPGDAEFILRTAVCWKTDAKMPAVLLTNPRVAAEVGASPELKATGVAVVGRSNEAAPQVFLLAEDVAA